MPKKDYNPLANRLLSAHRACLVDGVLHAFVDGRWVHGKDAVLSAIARMDRSTTRVDRAEVYDLVLRLAPERGYSDPRYLQFANRVLDIRTMDFREPSPDFLIPNLIPWMWDPTAVSDAVEEYLDSTATGDSGTRALIEEMLGASVSRARLPYIWVVVGTSKSRGGDAKNGKSTLLLIASLMAGRANTCELDVHDFGRHFMTVSLRGVTLAISTDTSSAQIEPASLSVLKRVPTQDPILADVKNAQAVRFRPYASVLIAANRVPGFVADSGLERRTVVVPLSGQFPEGAADPTSALDNDDCMSAMLVHAVTGLRRLLENGPIMTATGEDERAKLVSISSTVGQWSDERNVDTLWLDGQTCMNVYRDYQLWCLDAGYKPMPKGEFDRELAGRFPDVTARKCRRNGSTPTNRWVAVAAQAQRD